MCSLKKAKRKTSQLAYTTICRPIFEYASHVWSLHKNKLIVLLESINKKAFRWVYSFKNYENITLAMLEENWHPLAARRDFYDTKMLNRILSGKAAVDRESFLPHFSSAHNTRHGATKSGVNTNVAKLAFKHRMTSINTP